MNGNVEAAVTWNVICSKRSEKNKRTVEVFEW